MPYYTLIEEKMSIFLIKIDSVNFFQASKELRQKNHSEGYVVRENGKDAVAPRYLNKILGLSIRRVFFSRNRGIAIMASALREIAIRSSARSPVARNLCTMRRIADRLQKVSF